MATRFSSRLKSVPEKLKNYFTEQDDGYFSSEEADNVFVSGKFRTKLWNLKEMRVHPEHRVMEYHYVCIWQR